MKKSNLERKIERARTSEGARKVPLGSGTTKELLQEKDEILLSIKKSHSPGILAVMKKIAERAE